MIKIKKYKILLLGSLLLIAVLVLVYLATRYDSTPVVSNSGINYGPPTEEEKRAGDEQKQVGESDQSDIEEGTDSSGKKKANVIITDAGQYDSDIEVRAFINNYFQDGTCTITFKKDSLIITKETPAYKNISTTVCTVPEIKASEFSTKGDWQVTVVYTSADAEGTSAAQTITID